MEYLWVLTIIFGIITGISVFIIQNQFRNYKDKNDCQDREIEALKDKCHDLELTVKILDTKLWPEKKLTETINTSVRTAMIEAMNNLYEKGILNPRPILNG